MTTYEQELEAREAEYTFEDMFGDKIAVTRCGYENHPDVGQAEGVSIEGWDVHLPLVFSAAEARRLAAKLIDSADHADALRQERAERRQRAERIVGQAVADGRLIRRGDGTVIEPDRLPAEGSGE